MPYHVDTLAYLNRLTSAGGTINQSNLDLLDTKIRLLYAHGLRGANNILKYWLKTNLSDSFTGCLVPIYDDGVGNPTNNNFVEADRNADGLKGNSSNKTLNSNWNFAAQLGAFANRYDLHIGMWVTDVTDINTYGVLMGATTPAFALLGGITTLLNLSNNNDIELNTNVGAVGSRILSQPITASLTKVNGLYLGNRTALNSSRLLMNNSLRASNTAGAIIPVNPNYSCYFLSWGGITGSFSGARFSDTFMGYGLSLAQETALYTIMGITKPYYTSQSCLFT